MAHFAHVKNGVVDAVIVIERAVLEQANGWPINGVHCPLSEWVQTSFNTSSGDYKLGKDATEKLSLKNAGTSEDVKARNRKHYAGIGYSYDVVGDMFVPPKPYPSWVLDKVTGNWNAPKGYPKDLIANEYAEWDEATLKWVVKTRT